MFRFSLHAFGKNRRQVVLHNVIANVSVNYGPILIILLEDKPEMFFLYNIHEEQNEVWNEKDFEVGSFFKTAVKFALKLSKYLVKLWCLDIIMLYKTYVAEKRLCKRTKKYSTILVVSRSEISTMWREIR